MQLLRAELVGQDVLRCALGCDGLVGQDVLRCRAHVFWYVEARKHSHPTRIECKIEIHTSFF